MGISTILRYFEAHTPLENEVVDSFAQKYCHTDSDAKRARKSDSKSNVVDILRVGEQVHSHLLKILHTKLAFVQAAARISKADSGSWILVNILYFDATTERYDVQDEDDASRVLKLDAADVRKLEDISATLRRGDRVLAVFPETTCFYSGVVAKNPNNAATSSSGYSRSGDNDVIIRFDDDEDDQGRPVARKVPPKFLLPFENDDFDSDN